MDREDIQFMLDNYGNFENLLDDLLESIKKIDCKFCDNFGHIRGIEIYNYKIELRLEDQSCGQFDVEYVDIPVEWLFLSKKELHEVVNAAALDRDEKSRIKAEERRITMEQEKLQRELKQLKILKEKYEL